MTVRLSVLLLALVGCNDGRLVASGTSDAPTALPDGAAMVDGAVDGPSGVVGGAPRLIAPMSTSTVTQRRPTLHWTGGTAAPVVDLCRDRACTQPLAVNVAIAPNLTSAKVMDDLPPGWVFWRVHTGSDVTATWQFLVGPNSASSAVDTSFGHTLDVNGDGYGDFVVGAQPSSYLYLGGPNGASPQAIELASGSNAPISDALIDVGDINGDGYSDFWIEPHLFLGGPTTDGAIWSGDHAPNRLDWFFTYGYNVKGIGDVNGDGYSDLWISEGGGGYVWFGAATPTPAFAFTVTLVDSPTSPQDPNFLQFADAANAGDVNGDGYADFVVGAIPFQSSATSAYAFLYLGNAAPSAADWSAPMSPHRIDLPSPDSTFPYAGYFGIAVSGAGDFNGDGYSDFAVGAMDASAAHIYFGASDPASADWNRTAHAQRIDLSGGAAIGQLGIFLSPAGDVNGDGLSDLLIGAVDNLSLESYGGAMLYLGSAQPSSTIWNGASPPNRVQLVTPHGPYGYFGWTVASAGDADGDGYSDFLCAATGANMAHFYRGEATPDATHYNGVTPALRVDLTSPGQSSFFGSLGMAH